MSCDNCGRDDGHFLGCGRAAANAAAAAAFDDSTVVTDWGVVPADCAFGDCENPRRPKGKGPAPKYCEEHNDPKKRK